MSWFNLDLDINVTGRAGDGCLEAQADTSLAQVPGWLLQSNTAVACLGFPEASQLSPIGLLWHGACLPASNSAILTHLWDFGSC